MENKYDVYKILDQKCFELGAATGTLIVVKWKLASNCSREYIVQYIENALNKLGQKVINNINK